MKSRKDIILDMYFIERLRPVDIAKKLDISRSAVTQVLKKNKRYVEIKQVRKSKNQKKHIERTKEYMKTKRKIAQLQKNADDFDLRSMHNQASAELSQRKRLSNIAYRNWNKSAYKYNENKNRYEFREELGRSHDVPKYIKVEVL